MFPLQGKGRRFEQPGLVNKLCTRNLGRFGSPANAAVLDMLNTSRDYVSKTGFLSLQFLRQQVQFGVVILALKLILCLALSFLHSAHILPDASSTLEFQNIDAPRVASENK